MRNLWDVVGRDATLIDAMAPNGTNLRALHPWLGAPAPRALGDASAFGVTFLVGTGRSTEMRGRGRVVLDGRGVRFIGARPRLDGAFYGACAAALAAAVAAVWVLSALAGHHVFSVMSARPLLVGAGLGVFGVLCGAHAILIRLLPLAAEDRLVPFASGMRVDVVGDAVEVASDAPGFVGATWLAFDGGADERARFLDELATARQGGACAYRDALPS